MSRKRPPAPPASPGAAGMKEPDLAPAPAPGTQADDGKPKRSWYYRSARFMLRFAGVLLFLGYLGGTSTSVASWARVKWVRAQPLSNVTVLADKYLNMADRRDHMNRPDKLYRWVSLRPEAETEEIIRLLEPYTSKLSTLQFLTYSAHLKHLGKEEQALFYWQFTRFRGRYDALRCGSVKAVDNLAAVIDLFPHPDFPESELQDSAAVVKSIRAVLDMDAKYPAENNPDDVCEALRSLEPGNYATVQRPYWADIRHSLRFLTEYRLQKMEEALAAKKKPGKESTLPADKKPAPKKAGPGKKRGQ